MALANIPHGKYKQLNQTTFNSVSISLLQNPTRRNETGKL